MTWQEFEKAYPGREIKMIPKEYEQAYKGFGFTTVYEFEQSAFGKPFTYCFIVK